MIGPMSSPAYRASVCRGILASIDANLADREEIYARVLPQHLRAIRDVGPLGWVPAESLHALTRLVLQSLGSAPYVDFWRKHTVSQVNTPLFGSLFRGAQRLFGIEPQGLLRQLDRAWQSSTQGLGRIECNVSRPCTADIYVRELPTGAREDALSLSMQGSVLALIELAGRKGTVVCDTAQLTAAGEFLIRAAW